MNQHRINRSSFLVFLVFALAVPSIGRSQVQSSIAEVTSAPEEFPIKGVIYPQFWKAVLKDQIAFVPLDRVISFGIQDYEVTGGGHIHELSIAMDSQVMVRIYAVEPPTIVERVQQRTADTQERIEGVAGRVSPVSNIQTNSVVKHYPETTHQFMMEFRVPERRMVDHLFVEFEKAYLNYRMRELVNKQKPDAVHTTKVVNGISQ